MSGKSTVAVTAVSPTAVSQSAGSRAAATVPQKSVPQKSVPDASARWAALDCRHERLVTASDALLANLGKEDNRRMAS